MIFSLLFLKTRILPDSISHFCPWDTASVCSGNDLKERF